MNVNFSRSAAIPVMEEKFNRILREAEASAQSAGTGEADINRTSKELARAVCCIDELSTALEEDLPPWGSTLRRPTESSQRCRPKPPP